MTLEGLIRTPLFWAAAWLLLMCFVLFVVMGADKRRTRRGLRRVPEKTLFLLALLGGACGGWLGMRAFRHKTQHPSFVWGFSLLSLAQLGLLLFFMIRGLL